MVVSDRNPDLKPRWWSNQSSTSAFTNVSMEHFSMLQSDDGDDDGDERLLSYLPDSDDLDLHSQILHTALILFYGILILISLIGNGLVCRVLTCFKPSSCPIPQSTANSTGMSKMLIINLAISDLLLTTFNIPMNIVRFVSRDWPFGSFICTMMPLIQSISAYCSAWTMMVIAFERYRKIFHPRTLLKLQNMYRKKRENRKLDKLSHTQITHEHQNSGGSNPIQSGSDGSVEVCLTPTVTMYDSDGYSPIDFHNDKSPQQLHIPQSNKHHHKVLWRKISPDLGQTIGRSFSCLAYNCCTYCCCCCPIRCIPMPPASMVAFKTTNHNGAQIQSKKHWTLFGCSRHWSPSAIVAMIWIVSLILSIPHSLYTKIVHHDYVNMTRCTINAYPTVESKHFLTIYTFVTQYILPIGITSFCYIHIGVFLWRRETIGSISERRKKFLLKRKRKRVRLLIIVVATFAICWLPLNLYILLTDLDYIHHHQILFFLAHWFAMSSVCYNPFIYCWLNEIFRQKMTSILKLFWWNPLRICFPRQNQSTEHCVQCQTALDAIHNGHRNGGIDAPIDRVLEQILNDYHTQHHHNQMAMMMDQSDFGENSRADHHHLHHHHHQQNHISLASWSSTTNSGNTTGQQQAIFELRSMTAYLDQQQQLDSMENGQPHQQHQPKNNPLVTKEQRLALMTKQAGRRRYHGDQLLMMLNRQSQQLQSQSQTQQSQRHNCCSIDAQSSVDSPEVDQITKTTSLNLGSFSSSGSDSDCKASPPK